MDLLKDLGIPFVGFIIFFIIQSKGIKTELVLAIYMSIVLILTFLLNYHPNELLLFLIGIIMGIFVEIGLRFFGSQQTWKNASLFGVPYWLPLAWGIGFVIITRLGIFIRSL